MLFISVGSNQSYLQSPLLRCVYVFVSRCESLLCVLLISNALMGISAPTGSLFPQLPGNQLTPAREDTYHDRRSLPSERCKLKLGCVHCTKFCSARAQDLQIFKIEERTRYRFCYMAHRRNAHYQTYECTVCLYVQINVFIHPF